MKKPFKLPKEFAEKWLETLRSSKYKQGTGTLVKPPANELEIEDFDYKETDCSYCCLGVAGVLCGYAVSTMVEQDFLSSLSENYIVPDELLATQLNIIEETFPEVLAALNDGFAKDTFTKYSHLTFREGVIQWKDDVAMTSGDSIGQVSISLTFSQIADFIEDNCEFYT